MRNWESSRREQMNIEKGTDECRSYCSSDYNDEFQKAAVFTAAFIFWWNLIPETLVF